jgi:NADP-dependent 3-hydroxy acid dehydrogenase YdfG
MVDQFIQLGHVVAGCARSAVAIQQLNERYGSPHDFQSVDVSDDAQVHRWSRLVLDHGGPPDLLVNNAALINSSASLWQVPVDEFSQVIDVNIKGVFHVIRCFVPAMIERGEGVIVNFSSGWGRSTSREVAALLCDEVGDRRTDQSVGGRAARRAWPPCPSIPE